MINWYLATCNWLGRHNEAEYCITY